MSTDQNRYEVWRSTRGGWVRERTFRWKAIARIWAWEHTTRGWFTYTVVTSGERPR